MLELRGVASVSVVKGRIEDASAHVHLCRGYVKFGYYLLSVTFEYSIHMHITSSISSNHVFGFIFLLRNELRNLPFCMHTGFVCMQCVSSPSDETHYLIITVFIYFSSSDVFATILSFDFCFSLMIFQELNFTFLCFSSYLFVWCICMVTFSFFGLAASVVLLLGWL